MNKSLLICILYLSAFAISLQLKAQQPGEIISGEIIVQLHQSNDIQQLEKTFAVFDFHQKEIISKRLYIFLVSFDQARVNSTNFLSSLKAAPQVLHAQFNHHVELRESTENTPNDADFDQQWDMHNTGENGGVAGADIDALRAWDIATGGVTALGDTIVVAVIDGGCSLNHEDLNLYKNRSEIIGNGIDDDENGYIDDYNGWNAYNNSGTIPNHAHGTHVSGTLGARGNNGIGVSGVNWNVKVLPIAGSSTVESVVIKAYAYAYEMRALYDESFGQKGAFIVATNSSFGVNNGQPEDYPVWEAMYDSLGSLGILNAGATANANVNVDVVGDIPTAFETPWLITVTNTTNKDEKFSVAAYGTTTIDLGAPGTQIYSTKPNNSYGFSTGTSMACPHVAGATALLFSAVDSVFMTEYKANPAQKILEIKQYLLDGTDSLTDLQGRTVSGGRLNIYNSLMLLQHTIDLTLDKDSLSFVLPESSVGVKDFVVKNKGTDTVNLQIAVLNQPTWLLLSGDMFSIPPSDSTVVSVSASGLETGQFETNLQLFANESFFSNVLVKTLVYTPEILLSNDSIVFEMPVNTLYDTVITIKNPMPADCFVQMTSENMSPWIHVEPDTTTIAPNDSIQLNIDIDTHGITVGNYSVTLDIEAGIAGKHPLYVGIQVYDPSSVFESHMNQVRVSTTPNPFNEKILFSISLTIITPFDFTIYDNKGQIVYNQIVNPDNNRVTIEWDGRSANDVLCRAGSYYYSIKIDGRLMISGKILKH